MWIYFLLVLAFSIAVGLLWGFYTLVDQTERKMQEQIDWMQFLDYLGTEWKYLGSGTFTNIKSIS